jgi:catechol 2,3-dioxygenase-like lactoylglutathione lyase family enzyme
MEPAALLRGAMSESVVQFRGGTPILRVADFDASVAYYQKVLGFALEWQEGRFGSVRRNQTSFMLCEGCQGHPGTWVYVGVSDADALYREYLVSGARIRHEPRNFPWGSRELHVFDLDGHVLRLGSEAREGAPPGLWLDEDGVEWHHQPDGSWTRS